MMAVWPVCFAKWNLLYDSSGCKCVLYHATLISKEEAAADSRAPQPASTVQEVTQSRVYLTSGRWQSICRYFWGRSWRSPPSSLCRRAAAALHQTRSICSQTQSACSACLPRSRPSSKRAASARERKRAQLREQGLNVSVIRGDEEDDDGDDEVAGLKRRWRWLQDAEAGGGCCTAGGGAGLQPITPERGDVMRVPDCQHQDHFCWGRGCACLLKDVSKHTYT